tara:strand:- start:27 stop:1037 length:1011 start_codon:yes stop_codon:yes gene_type:complete
MNNKNIKRIFHTIIIGVVLLSSYIYSQDCDDGYTYIADDDIPASVTILDQDNCFSNEDLTVLDSVFILNDLGNEYESSLHMGIQTWATGRLKVWVAKYVPSGGNGMTQQIDHLPDNIGQLSELTTLFLEGHLLTELPASFTSLSSLVNLYISSNWLTSLPEDFGNLTSLSILDLGYNQLASIPESIGELINIQYLLLFNNQLTSLPESICDLNLDWDGIDPVFQWPYFASGGNYLCDPALIPDCVENSTNFEISMDQFYYSFLLDAPQICCPELGDINGDSGWNVLDIVALANCVLADNCGEIPYGCAGDTNGDGWYNVLDIVALANCVLADSCGS